MTFPRFLMPLALLAAPLAMLSGCGDGVDDQHIRAVAIAAPGEESLSVARLPLTSGGSQLRAATAQGLVGFDPAGRVQPGLAARWIVTDDGLSYIFRLEDARWNDGEPVTADEVVKSIRARLAELRRNGSYAAELASITQVVAMTDRVVEIDLRSPRPSVLEMLAQPEFGLLRDGQGSGPMKARALPGGGMELRRRLFDEEERETADTRSVTLRSDHAALAMVRFQRGQADIVTDGRFQHLPLLSASNVRADMIRMDPVAGLFGLSVENGAGLLQTQELREALAMAIDRPRLLSSFGIAGWQEQLTLVPEGLERRAEIGRPLWASSPIEQRRALARQRVAEWVAANGPAPALRIALPDGAGSRILFARIAADLRLIGVPTERVAAGASADLRLIDRVSDFDSQLFYLAPLSCPRAKLCSESADLLIAQARDSADLNLRSTLLGEAEVTLARFVNFIPLASPVRFSLVRPGLDGFAPNPRGRHLLQYLGGPTTSR